MAGVLAEGMIAIVPLPVPTPMVLAALVPILTVPPRMLIPEKIPDPEAVVADVENEMAVMVFPCISEAGEAATVSPIGTRLALPVKVLVPVPEAELYPVMLLLTVYPPPLAVTMLISRCVPLIDLDADWKNRFPVMVQAELLLTT